MVNLSNLINNWKDLDLDQKNALEEYYEAVETLSDKGLNVEFNNKDANHAAIVMAGLFKSSTKSIKIFCESFKGPVNNNSVYTDELQKALDRGVTIDVVFESAPNEDSSAYKILSQYEKKHSDQVKLNVLNKSYLKKLEESKLNLGNFSIGDDRIFRYETDKKLFQAICNFDDKITVENLNANFAILALNALGA